MAIPPVKILPDLIVDGRIVKRDENGNEIIIASTSSFSSSVPIYAPNLSSSLTSSYALTAAYAENAGTGISSVSSSGNITGSGLSGNEIRLKDNITLSSVTSSFNGNLLGTASFATSASFSLTASYAANANIDTSSFATRSEVTGALTPYALSSNISASFASLSGVSSSFVTPSQVTSSVSSFPIRSEVTGVLSNYATTTTFNNFSGSYNTGSFSGSFLGTASFATSASYAANANIDTSSFATTGSNQFKANQTITGSLFLDGRIVNTGTSIVGAPALNGTTSRLVLWNNNNNPAYYTYGLGIEANHMWFGVDVNNSAWGFKWYAENVQVMKLDGVGNLTGLSSVTSSNGFNGRLYGTSSYALTSGYAENTVQFPTRAEITGTLSNYGTLTGISSSFVTPSQFTSSVSNFPARSEITGVLGNYATTGSNTFNGNQVITGNLDVLGTVTVEDLHITYVTSSIIYTSGSTKFGDTLDDTHQFTGSLFITGNITADRVFSTSSFSVTSSHALTAAYAETTNLNISNFPTRAEITGTLIPYALSSDVSSSFVTATQVTGAINSLATRTEVSGAITSSLTPYATLVGLSASFSTPTQISGVLNDYLTTSSFNSFSGSYNTGSFTGSFIGTSSYALTAAYAANATANISNTYNSLREIVTGTFDANGSKLVELQKFADTDIDYITLDITTKPNGMTYYTNDLISFQMSGNLSNKLEIYLSAPAYGSTDRYKIIAVKETGSF